MVTAAETRVNLLEDLVLAAVAAVAAVAALEDFLRSGSSGEGRRVEGSC